MAQDEAVDMRNRRLTNQVAGLAVFLLGIILLVLVFLWAKDLYGSIEAPMFATEPTAQQPQVEGTPSSEPLPKGALKAQPRSSAALTPVAMALLAKLLSLFVMGWVAGLIAGKGIHLATAVTRRE